MKEDKGNVTSGELMSSAQVVAVGAVAFLVIGVSIAKFGFPSIKANTSKAMDTQLTFDQLYKQKLGEVGTEAINISNIDILDQGQVLGVSNEIDETLKDFDEILSKEQLRQLPIKISNDNSREAIEEYFQRLDIIEGVSGYMDLLAMLSSGQNLDKMLYDQKLKTLITEVGSIEVPSSVATYQRIRLLFYTSLSELGPEMYGESSEAYVDKVAVLFSINEKMERLHDQIFSFHNLTQIQ